MIEIRPVSPDDAETLVDLHLTVWEEAYADLMPDSVFAERRARPRDEEVERRRTWASDPAIRTIVADRGGELVGFANAGRGRDPGVDSVEQSPEAEGLHCRMVRN